MRQVCSHTGELLRVLIGEHCGFRGVLRKLLREREQDVDDYVANFKVRDRTGVPEDQRIRLIGVAGQNELVMPGDGVQVLPLIVDRFRPTQRI